MEIFNAGDPIELVELNGTWRLQYTSAPDVLILLESAARLPFFQVFYLFPSSQIDPSKLCVELKMHMVYHLFNLIYST